MTRQEFLNLLNRKPTVDDVVTVLTEYCQKQKELYDKNRNVVETCIAQLIRTGQWPSYFEYAKDSLMTDYHICVLYDVEKPTPFGPSRQPLKYF